MSFAEIRICHHVQEQNEGGDCLIVWQLPEDHLGVVFHVVRGQHYGPEDGYKALHVPTLREHRTPSSKAKRNPL